jgi:hybrid cluster-associated redox disulfide protein
MNENINPNLSVEETLRRWPETIPVFLMNRMGCVGCTMAAYESLSNAAEIYRLPLDKFISDLQQAIQQQT